MGSYRRRSSNDPTKGSVAYLRKNEITIHPELYASVPGWVMVDERCAWSGDEAKRLVEGVVSDVQLRVAGHIVPPVQNILSCTFAPY